MADDVTASTLLDYIIRFAQNSRYLLDKPNVTFHEVAQVKWQLIEIIRHAQQIELQIQSYRDSLNYLLMMHANF